MTFWMCMDLFSFLVYMSLGIYILVKNPKAPINRVFFGLVSCFAVWAFTATFFDDPNSSKNTVMLAINICALGWVSFGSFVLLFFLIFTEKTKILQYRWLYPVLVMIPVFFLYQQWFHGALISDCLRQPYGSSIVWGNSIWKYFFYAYYFLFTGGGLLMVVDYWRKTDDAAVKQQAKIIFYTGTFAFFLGSLVNVVLPELNIRSVPPFAYHSLLLFVCGIAYVIVKYRFLTITPATAADNIISTMMESLILLNPSGRIVTVNKAAVDLLGYENKELEGKAFSVLIADKGDTGPLIRKLEKQQLIINEDLLLKNKSGEEIPVIFSVSLLKDANGLTAGAVCIGRDISDRIKIQKKLLEIQKFESLRTLAGGVAHEYNNKLSVLLGSIDIIQLKLPENQNIQQSIEKMKAATLKMRDLTSQLVAYAREGKYQPDIIYLCDLVEESLSVFQHDLDKNIRIKKQLPDRVSNVRADFSQIQLVLNSILHNASEAIDGSGGIHISVSDVDIKKDASGPYAEFKPGKYVCLTVKDDGIGMEDDTLEQIFDPFASTKGHGRGLGMAAVYGIVKNHDGYINIESKAGQGTVVSIYLPAE